MTEKEPFLIRCVFYENARREYPDPENHASIDRRNPRALLRSPYVKGYFGYADGWNLFSQFREDKVRFRFGLHRVLQLADDRFLPVRLTDRESGKTFDAMLDQEGGLFLRCRHESRRKGLDPVPDGLEKWDESRYIAEEV